MAVGVAVATTLLMSITGVLSQQGAVPDQSRR